MILNVDGGDIFYESSEDLFSTTKPVLFVLPGGPGGTHGIYKFHSLELETYFCVIYHDPRGCGNSKNFPAASAAMDNYIADIEKLRNHLGLQKISILGTSYGSMCAIGYATLYSANLDRLILIAGAPSYKFLETAKLNLEKRGTEEQKKICQNLWEGSFTSDDQVRDFMRIMKPLYSNNKDFINANSGNTPTFSYQVLNNGFGGFLKKFNFDSSLNKITCQTLILVGEDDWINDPVHLRYAAQHIPNARIEVLKDCAHFVAIDQHEKYIDLIKTTLVSTLTSKI
jgi:proline iminopeptidase